MNRWEALVVVVFIIGLVSLTIFSQYEDAKTKQDAIRAGLIQKTDEHGNIIWVKP